MPGPTVRVVPDRVATLRAHGLRATRARLLVMAALDELEHPTVDALHRRTASDGVVLTTVYRTLETLEKAGLVWAVHVPGTGRTYHLGTHRPHAHLLCRGCGRLDDLPVLPGTVLVACGVPDDFSAEHVQLTVVGRCARCASSPPGPEQASASASASDPSCT